MKNYFSKLNFTQKLYIISIAALAVCFTVSVGCFVRSYATCDNAQNFPDETPSVKTEFLSENEIEYSPLFEAASCTPSEVPTEAPTQSPTLVPTQVPTQSPTYKPVNSLYARSSVIESKKLPHETHNPDTVFFVDNIDNVDFVLGDYVYCNKNELFKAFYSEFYNFIMKYYGSSEFKRSKVTSVTDFLSLEQKYYYIQSTFKNDFSLYFSHYFLNVQYNLSIEDQSATTSFLGYLYKNGIMADFVRFIEAYFAYWRIDEGYTKKGNRGSDLFADSWAALCDIGQFFYYDLSNSRVKSARVLNCFRNPACVATVKEQGQNFSGGKLPVLCLRFHNFEGWYDNPEYTGEPYLTVPETEKGETVTLYAKWSDNEEERQLWNARIVDIHIYNLNSQASKITQSTVNSVLYLYSKLPDYAKSNVTLYNDFINGLI